MRVTNKFRISRVLTASAVLLSTSTNEPVDAKLAQAVCGQAATFIQRMWNESAPKLKYRYQVNDFWRRIVTQVTRSQDVAALTVKYKPDHGPAYGHHVVLTMTVNPTLIAYTMEIN